MDPRKEKRGFRKMGMDHPVYIAWLEGCAVAMGRFNPYINVRDVNPYPAGRRHDEWQRGSISIAMDEGE